MAGGPEKCAYLMNELHLAGAIDYKESRSAHGRTVAEQLDALAPDGVDFFMDQVGGDILQPRHSRPRHARYLRPRQGALA